MREHSIVGRYYRLSPSKRFDEIVFHYDHFQILIRDYEKDIEDWLYQGRALVRQADRGELGVRIQSGNASVSVVEITVEEKMQVENVIKTGRLDEFSKRLPNSNVILRGLMEIKLMRREYDRLKIKLHLLRPDDQAVFERYIQWKDRSAELSAELAISRCSRRFICYN